MKKQGAEGEKTINWRALLGQRLIEKMVGLFRRNDPNQRQSHPGPRMTQIPANKSHPGSADVLVGHAPQGVLASPPPSRFDAGEMHYSPRNGAFAPEIWADTEVSPPNIRVSSFRFASFAPAHVALRAAFGRLPSQHPLACVQVSPASGLSPFPLPLCVPARDPSSVPHSPAVFPNFLSFPLRASA